MVGKWKCRGLSAQVTEWLGSRLVYSFQGPTVQLWNVEMGLTQRTFVGNPWPEPEP